MLARLASLLLVVSPAFLAGSASVHDDLAVQIRRVSERIAEHPRDAALYARRAELHRLTRSWPAAHADLARVAALEPAHPDLELLRARLYRDCGWRAKARAAVERLLSARSDHAEGLFLRARLRVEDGEFEAGARDYARAIAAVGTPRPEHYLERAASLLRSGERGSVRAIGHAIGRAIECIDAGVARLGSIPSLELAAVALELRAERYEAALARLDRVARRSPRKERWLVERGEVLLAAGRHSEAVACFEAAEEEIRRLRPSKRRTRAVAA